MNRISSGPWQAAFAFGRPSLAPLAKALRHGARRRRSLALHLPAHGRGRGLAPGLEQVLRLPPASWDLPELPAIGGPLLKDGAVAAAQRRSAALLGADHCWFGVNGASGLLQAALLGLAPPGSRVLLPRNLHRSLLHGCVLGGLRPLLFDLPFDAATGLWLPPDPAWMERVLAAALAGGPVAAVVLVSPTYQGQSADLGSLAAQVHAAGLPLLVDQAHGRGEAIAAGADLVVLSCQKAFGGLAQSAVLLAQGDRLQLPALEHALLWLQTSSPSALLLASSEAAIAFALSTAGRRRRSRAEALAAKLRSRCRKRKLPLLPGTDPLRLVLDCAALGINGLAADDWLIERGVIAELPEPGTLTFCLGESPAAAVVRRLPRRLLALARALGGEPLPPFSRPPLPLVAEPERSPAEAWRAAAAVVPLADAAGRIAAEPLCPYPPGIPLLIPGERIDPGRLGWLLEQARVWPGQIADTVRVLAL